MQSLLAMRPAKTMKKASPSFLSICTIVMKAFRKKTVQRRISPIPNANPASEGRTMLIHLLTCLALTAVTLTLFSRFFLDIDPSEEHPS